MAVSRAVVVSDSKCNLRCLQFVQSDCAVSIYVVIFLRRFFLANASCNLRTTGLSRDYLVLC